MRCFLIGFMGSGKTEIGKELSNHLLMNHIDLDSYIEQKESKTISQIFNEKGEEEFRKIEKLYLLKIIQKDNLCISLGGGTIIFNKLIDLIKYHGETIYLKCSIETLYKRLENIKNKRPLLSQVETHDLKEYIRSELSKRKMFYEQAKYIINNDTNKSTCIRNIIHVLR